MNFGKYVNLTARWICLGIATAGMILWLMNFKQAQNFDWSTNQGITGIFFLAFGTLFWFMIHGTKEYRKEVKENTIN